MKKQNEERKRLRDILNPLEDAVAGVTAMLRQTEERQSRLHTTLNIVSSVLDPSFARMRELVGQVEELGQGFSVSHQRAVTQQSELKNNINELRDGCNALGKAVEDIVGEMPGSN